MRNEECSQYHTTKDGRNHERTQCLDMATISVGQREIGLNYHGKLSRLDVVDDVKWDGQGLPHKK